MSTAEWTPCDGLKRNPPVRRPGESKPGCDRAEATMVAGGMKGVT